MSDAADGGLPGSLPPGALTGIRVLDFTRFMQGPYATRILADLGAEVIKVERPGGEWDRRLRLSPEGFGGFFHALNRGKGSMAVDITTDEGREIILKLAAECDVVIENFRSGTMDRLGLGYEQLRAVNPRIIFAAGSGYGPHGPHASDPMFDMVAQAVSGVSDFNRSPEGEPRLATRGLADVGGGMFLAMAVLAALFVRERTGEGQRVDASLMGAAIGMHTAEITIALDQDRVFRLGGGRVTSTSGAFKAGDGQWLVIGATDQKLWNGLSKALGLAHLSDDERFSRSRAREANRAVLEPLIEEAFLTRPRAEWLGILQQNDVPVAPVNTFLDLADDPDVKANDYIIEQDDRRWGKVKIVGLPFHLERTPGRVGETTPELGESTLEQLERIGMTREQIDRLVANEVVELLDPSSLDSASLDSSSKETPAPTMATGDAR